MSKKKEVDVEDYKKDLYMNLEIPYDDEYRQNLEMENQIIFAH